MKTSSMSITQLQPVWAISWTLLLISNLRSGVKYASVYGITNANWTDGAFTNKPVFPSIATHSSSDVAVGDSVLVSSLHF